MDDKPAPEWTFSDRVRKVRRDYTDLGQREFADAIGIAQPTYAAWESGANAGPRDSRTLMSVSRRIARLTGVSLEWIMGLQGDQLAPLTSTERASQ